ncbi:ATP-utilizing chromatin assembly and remodelling N-terminal-domain-containing protein [Protomyces lactucae-debilis]|uniref:ATP-utilizing chromatin assembly and remodelling N-terminal-domain-containing protein n=1 Tax=Protomyces lactucae-debilis TaxID=2754530 RepID=A0A1Y2FKL7_PROLT|nr:ATP-utilizing chromatin assembly and remodelling N-terminal-domain-containing protein [Protomyces lactucae-debilis]ORY83904.1 ATP-utilizing chromatin assembly and remodelling N-terminal-domain-containing protein [Protomyces lactucae-debilis]
MVLYKRNPVQYARDNPDKLPLNALVWEIRETREVFADYEAFLKRLSFYEQHQFTCELTGRQNLPFKIAMQSEVQGSTGIDNSFPEALKEPLLRRLNLHTDGRLEHLVDLAFEAYKAEYFPGEILIYTEPNTARRFAAHVREKTMLAEMTMPNGQQRQAASRYTVELEDYYNGRSNATTIDGSTLARERGTFTKAILRAFIKNAFRKDNWQGAPWVVRSHYAERYKIDTTIPPHLQKGGKVHLAAQQAKQAKKKKPLEAASIQEDEADLPMDGDDLLVPISKTKRPALSPVETELAPVFEHFLEVWAFFNVFNEILILDAFTLDDFRDALLHQGPSELVNELYCSLIVALKQGDESPLDAVISPPDEALNTADGDVDEIATKQPDVLEAAREDLVYATGQWRDKLAKQALHEDGFIEILVGLCCELSRADPNAACGKIVRELAASDGELPDCFRSLACTLKVELLYILIDLLLQTPLIRDYMEECSRNLTKVRKERVEANRIKRSLMDDIYKLRLGMRAQYPLKKSAAGAEAAAAILDSRFNGGSSNQRMAASVASEELSDEEMGDNFDTASVDSEESAIRTTRRGAKRPNGSKLKNEILVDDSDSSLSDLDEDKSEAHNETKQYSSRAEYELDITKIQRKVARQNTKLATLDADFRESDMQRLKQLGQDRFNNTYWFLEAVGMPYKGMPSQSTSHAGYAAGRVFVQGPDPFATAFMASILPAEALHSRKQQELPASDVGLLQSTSDWAYYDQPEQLEKLHSWLFTQGNRETKLRQALESRYEIIAESMEARTQYLIGRPDQIAERRSLRHATEQDENAPRFFVWRNTMALNILGRSHSDPLVQKGKAVTRKRQR